MPTPGALQHGVEFVGKLFDDPECFICEHVTQPSVFRAPEFPAHEQASFILASGHFAPDDEIRVYGRGIGVFPKRPLYLGGQSVEVLGYEHLAIASENQDLERDAAENRMQYEPSSKPLTSSGECVLHSLVVDVTPLGDLPVGQALRAKREKLKLPARQLRDLLDRGICHLHEGYRQEWACRRNPMR